MTNDQRMTNDQCPIARANVRRSHWSLVIGHRVLLAHWSLVISVLAQPAPKLNSTSPEWVQRGNTIQIVFAGENLGNVTGFIFSGEPGLTATNLPSPVPPKPSLTIESDQGGITRIDPQITKDDKR